MTLQKATQHMLFKHTQRRQLRQISRFYRKVKRVKPKKLLLESKLFQNESYLSQSSKAQFKIFQKASRVDNSGRKKGGTSIRNSLNGYYSIYDVHCKLFLSFSCKSKSYKTEGNVNLFCYQKHNMDGIFMGFFGFSCPLFWKILIYSARFSRVM